MVKHTHSFTKGENMNRPFILCVDAPVKNKLIDTFAFKFSGWIASSRTNNIQDVYLKKDGQIIPLNLVDRPDVIKIYKNYYVIGFNEILSVLKLGENNLDWELFFKIDEDCFNIPIEFNILPGLYHHAEEMKRRKIKKIFPLLQCPYCKLGNFSQNNEYIQCNKCHSRFSYNLSQFNFLTDELKQIGAVKSTENISSNNYDPIILKIINENKDKLILDNGAGLREYWYENVINYEIVDYPSTDVVGIGEVLPFKSESFDIIFSLAVLEHVKNPFQCSEEIIRVLKKGGLLVAVVPFLQPYHGYPDHYYNMTSNGLKNLFKEKILIKECFVPQSGLPIWALTWFLQLYLSGLPDETAEQFRKMKIEDLLQDAKKYLDMPFVKELDSQTNETLACTNYLIGQKI
jgi:SAM-dependent methyltransferase